MTVANGQIVFTAAGEEFYERVDWFGDEPVSGRPHEDPVSPIRVNPLVRSGLPAVGGISTEAITGELTAEPPGGGRRRLRPGYRRRAVGAKP